MVNFFDWSKNDASDLKTSTCFWKLNISYFKLVKKRIIINFETEVE